MIAINVAQLLKMPTGTTRDLAFSDPLPELSPEFDLAGPVEGRAHLMRTSRGILASTSYRTVVRQTCGRCLEPTAATVQGTSADEFLPRVDVFTGHPLDDQPQPDEPVIDDRHVLDLTEVIRQDLLTRLPLQPLCEADCPGLCPECGQERRSGGCACGHRPESGSPFAGLAELLRREAANETSSG